jgi:amidase
MTKNVIDNGILMDAMRGFDEADEASVQADWKEKWYQADSSVTLKGKRFGAFRDLMQRDSIYKQTIDRIRDAGGVVIEIDASKVEMEGFISILNLDMKSDLPRYLATQVKNKEAVAVGSIEEIIRFNQQDSTIRMPYGQGIFEGMLKDTTSVTGLKNIKSSLQTKTRYFFNTLMVEHRLDAVLSINNYHAGYAAAATYPALTIPMGYKPNGEPVSLTFIAKQYQEGKLYELGTAFEQVTRARTLPKGYE